jgi:hypothetical protein
MIRHLTLKPDFARTVERFEAWWQRQIVDRPPVTLHVRPNRQPAQPPSEHATQRERWLDVEHNVVARIAAVEAGTYPGDSLPIAFANVGPELTGTLYGCDLEFSERTSWSKPIVHRAEDWRTVIETPPDFGNVYWQTVEAMTAGLIERCDGRYLVGLPDLHGNYDILASLREPEDVCLDLIDCPELLREVGRHVAAGFVAAYERCWRQVREAGFGATTWTPCYHEGAMYVPSCDFWCMVSPAMAEQLILPDIRAEMTPLARSIFHLDGPQALPHLDLLLEQMPDLDAVQWVYGTGHGPAARWIDVYRRCQAAGKAVQVLAADANDALAVLDGLSPEGVWLQVGEPFDSADQADAFLEEVGRRASR